jgi:hypothetical protein
MTGFLENLYRLKAREAYRTPLMLMIDEADAIAPQKPFRGEERMLGAAEDIVRRGGQRGIGCTLITQRSAVLNKNVLTQIQILVALRTIAPQDLDALKAWVDVHGTQEQRKTLMESLPSLPVGDAWVWSPGWPTDDGIFQRVHVLPIETFDSGATPGGGKQRAEPRNLADVDLDALKRQMAATIERAKAEDPRELRKTIADLRAQLVRAQAVRPAAAPATKAPRVVEKPVLKEAHVKRLEAAANKIEKAWDLAGLHMTRTAQACMEQAAAAKPILSEIKTALAAARTVGAHEMTPNHGAGRFHAAPGRDVTVPAEQARPAPVVPPVARVTREPRAAGELGVPHRRVIVTLAALGRGLTREELGVRCGYRADTGHFGNVLSDLRSAGLIGDAGRGVVALTQEGITATSKVGETAYSPAELVEAWKKKFGSAEVRTLDALLKAWPEGLTREEAGAAVSLRADTGHFGNTLSALRTNGLAETNREGRIVVHQALVTG